VKLGLLPGAGGTQRSPRVAGIEAAVEMCATGTPVGAKKALAIGLIDRLAGEDSLSADAIAFAREMIAHGPRPSRDLPVRGDVAAIAAFAKTNARKFRGFEAPAANLACIEAATRLSFDEGTAFERQQFFKLLSGVQSAAQRHIFFAERQAGKIDGIGPDVKPRAIDRVGVIGAGTMGGGISMNFLSAGIPVTIVEMQQEALDKGTAIMRRNYEASAAKGRLKPEQVEGAMLTPTLAMEDLADCDLIIEAVYENMDVKKEIFGRLDKIAKPGAIIASNTSYLDIDEIAASTSRPQDVLGTHFFSPANVMKLLEVVRGAKTAPDALMTAMSFAKKIGKIAVVAGVCHGFIGNRMLEPRQVEAMKLLMEGATPNRSTRFMSISGCRWGHSRWPTLPVSISAGTATRPASRASAMRWRRSVAGGRKRLRDFTITMTRVTRHRQRKRNRSSTISLPKLASRNAQSPIRRSSNARFIRWSTKAR
jgi:3-hydroxyacyl-CoA dehydrogenase